MSRTLHLRLGRIAIITLSFVLLITVSGRAGSIVNIDATQYGFNIPSGPTDPAPVVGQIITPGFISPATGLNQLVLGAGTYTVTNATGLAGANANFTGWRFNGNPNWVWNFVVADNATDKVVLYGEAGALQSSQAAVAAQSAVQNFSATLVLPATTTLDFMIRDYYLPDNAGGVALDIEPAATGTPVPKAAAGTAVLLALFAARRLSYRVMRRTAR